MGAIVKNGINYTNSSSPTKTSELVNDSGFITKAVNDLVNYYLKSETYSKAEVDAIATAIKNSRFEAVQTLPTTDIKTNVIYLVPSADPQAQNVKDEYINTDGTTSGWEIIGSTSIDLSGYVTTTDLNTALADYVESTDLATVATSGDYDDLINKPSIPTVSATQILSTGTKIGSVTVDNTTTEFFAPSGGGGGTSDYSELTNKPSINDVTLSGNKSSSDLGLAPSNVADNCYNTGDTSFTDLADADYVPVYDSSASAKKKSLWSNIKSVLKSYFDTVYDLNKNDIPMYGTSSTGASTTAKTASVSRGTFTLVAGAKVSIKFTNTNTASAPTLNVSSKGAKNIKYIASDGTVTTPTTWWGAGEVVTFMYDGTQWLMMPTISMIPSMPVLGTINRSDIYDTTEKVVGKWTDGRPVYQKVITADTPTVTTVGTTATSYVSIGASVKWVVDLQAYMNDATQTQFMQIPFMPGTQDRLSSNTFYQVACRVNTNSDSSNPNSIVITSNRTSDNNKELTFVIRYTKTTDAANSYNYANENDYSTSEKIVGTWIDGKPIYQKTLTGTLNNTSAAGTEVTTSVAMGVNVSKYISFVGTISTATGNHHIIPTLRMESTTLQEIRIVGWDNSAASSKNTMNIHNSWYTNGTNTYTVTVQYTKTT